MVSNVNYLLSIELFFEHVTGHEPDDYQKEFLNATEKRIAVRAARQVGKSVMASVKILYQAFMFPRQEILVVAPFQRQASLLFWKIKNILLTNEYIRSKVIRETLTQIHFDNGSAIHCIPGGRLGKSITGFSPQMLLADEDAVMPDEVWEQLEPCVRVSKGQIIRLSTPFGKQGEFYRSFLPGSGYRTFHIRASDCSRYSKEDLKLLKKTKDEFYYQTMYEGEFVEEADNYFPLSLIKDRIHEVEHEGPEGKNYILGVDFARYGHSRTVYMVAEFDGKTVNVVKIIATSKKPLNEAIGRITSLHNDYIFENIYVDDSTIGGGPIDVLIEKGLPIVRCNFHQANKAKLYKRLKFLMERKKITYPDDEDLKMEMANLKYKYSSNGLLTLEAPSKGRDDHPDTLAILCKSMMFERDSPDDFIIRSA